MNAKQLKIYDIDEFYDEFGFEPEDKYETQLEEIMNMENRVDEEFTSSHEINLLDNKIDTTIDEIRKTVVSQDEAIKKIVTAVYKNYLFNDPEMKSNILVYGPTGVGKTEIIRQLGKILKLPVLIEDMTRYTPAGYIGGNLDNILAKLYLNADKDLELAQKSILILDEIDKKASANTNDKEFMKSDVLKSLLKIIEGGVFDIDIPGGKTINFDTSNLTIIAMGAFSELHKEKEKTVGTIGFNAPAKVEEETLGIDTSDFVKYGFQPEFIGRFNTIVPLKELKKEDLIEILKHSRKSPIRKYAEVLEKIGVDFAIKDEIYEKIASKAIDKRTGARGLKLVTDEIFNDVLFEIFNEDKKEDFSVTYDFNDEVPMKLRKKNK